MAGDIQKVLRRDLRHLAGSEQDEEGNFIHSSDEEDDQGAQVEEDPNPIRNNSKAIADGRRDVGQKPPRLSRRDASNLLPHRPF